jgi:CPA1 family monovalent cation:H+ antiporter
MLKSECVHFDAQAAATTMPKAEVCEVCGIKGPLRMCATCGFVGCCESMNSHDTEHWKETGHPIIVRMPLNEASWVWCYEHHDYLRDHEPAGQTAPRTAG